MANAKNETKVNANMLLWDSWSRPPQEAMKAIGGGRLKGKTDINPQWRMKVLTEMYGPIGLGWYYEVLNKWTEPGAGDEIMVFADIHLYVSLGDDHWSKPIYGIGGNMLVELERSGLHSNDEGYKMAITDALSVACKELGIGSEIYEGNFDGSKYTRPREETPRATKGSTGDTPAGRKPSGGTDPVWDPENPGAYVLTFGAHKGKTLREAGSGYANWMLDKIKADGRESKLTPILDAFIAQREKEKAGEEFVAAAKEAFDGKILEPGE